MEKNLYLIMEKKPKGTPPTSAHLLKPGEKVWLMHNNAITQAAIYSRITREYTALTNFSFNLRNIPGEFTREQLFLTKQDLINSL